MLKKYCLLAVSIFVIGTALASTYALFCETLPENKQLKTELQKTKAEYDLLEEAYLNSMCTLEDNGLVEYTDSSTYFIPLNITNPTPSHHKAVDYYNHKY